MSDIKLELDSGMPSVLHHFGQALIAIAADHGYTNKTAGPLKVNAEDKQSPVTEDKVSPPTTTEVVYEPKDYIYMMSEDELDVVLAKSESERDELLKRNFRIVDRSVMDNWESGGKGVEQVEEENDEIPEYDKEGIKWDARIHSDGKTLLKNGTWRQRKTPAEHTKDSWEQYVSEVIAEQKRNAPVPEDITEEKEPVASEVFSIAPPPLVSTEAEIVTDGHDYTFEEIVNILSDNFDKLSKDDLALLLARSKVANVRELKDQSQQIRNEFIADLNQSFLNGK